MSKPLTIGDYSRDGLLQITDTNWDHNGTLRVTVRELIGGPHSWIGGREIEQMRRLARRALEHPETIRSSRIVNTFYSQGSWHYTFAVSRLPSTFADRVVSNHYDLQPGEDYDREPNEIR